MNLRSLFSRSFDPRKIERCPNPSILAAFVDRALTGQQLGQIRRHLMRCDECFDAVEQLSQLSLQPLPPVPDDLERQAKALVRPSRRFSFLPPLAEWRMAGALATLCLGVVVGAWVLIGERAPSGPGDSPSGTRSVRGSETALPPLLVLSPEENEVIPRGQLRFAWNEVPGAVAYEVSVVDPEATLIWTGQVADALAVAPPEQEIPPGKYFVLVQGRLATGRLVKAGFVRFTLAD